MKRLIGILLCAGGVAGAGCAWAQNYPVKPVRMIVGFAAGSTTDLIGRVIAQKMSEGLGQPVIMENRPGAGANIAHEVVSRAPPDDYTVMIANAGIATGATAYVKLNFNALRDFAPVSQVSSTPHLLVIHPSLPVKSVKELTAFTKARPGQLNFASTGHGNSDHISQERDREIRESGEGNRAEDRVGALAGATCVSSQFGGQQIPASGAYVDGILGPP